MLSGIKLASTPVHARTFLRLRYLCRCALPTIARKTSNYEVVNLTQSQYIAEIEETVSEFPITNRPFDLGDRPPRYYNLITQK